MNKIKNIALIIWAVLTALFYVLLKSKDRKIEKQQDQIKQQQSKNEELAFINKQNQEAKNEKNIINSSSESDVDRVLEQTNSYRD